MTLSLFIEGIKAKINNAFKFFYNYRKVPRKWTPLSGFKTFMHTPDKTAAELSFENGRMVITGISPGILKVEVMGQGSQPYSSYSVLSKERFALSVKKSETAIEIKNPTGEKLLVNTDTGVLSVFYNGAELHHEIHPASFSGEWISCKIKAPVPEMAVGFGQKTGGLFKNNSRMIIWNTDNSNVTPKSDPLYQNCPLFISLRDDGTAHALFFDNPHYSVFNLKDQDCFYAAEKGPLTYYILSGPELKDVLSQYTLLTGKYPLPPRWVLGHHHSRWEEPETGEKILQLAEDFRRHKIPCDVLHIDIGHLEGYRCFTWHPDHFPDPGECIKKLHEKSFKVVTIVDAGLKKDEQWDIYKEGKEKDYFCKTSGGEIYHGPVWPGESVFPEFSVEAVAVWWGHLYKHYTDIGVDGFWNDMNEPSVFTARGTMPDDVIHRTDEKSLQYDHKSIHNLFGLLMARAGTLGLRKLQPEKRPFLFTRSSFAGIQRYASTWTGDNSSNWQHLAMSVPMILNMGLSGQVMTGPDIGGFWKKPSAELMMRWIAVGAFYPFCRNHTSLLTPPQEFWNLGEEVLTIARQYLSLRYSLLPYFYTRLSHSCKTGLPFMAPLFMEFPGDNQCYTKNVAETEFMVGDSLLAAPILAKGEKSRSVYLPAGEFWVDWWSLEKREGGKKYQVNAPFNRMPLFVRSGRVITTGGEGLTVEDIDKNPLTMLIFPGKFISGDLYLDDGTSIKYHTGDFTKITLSGESAANKMWIAVVKEGGRSTGNLLYKHSGFILKILTKGKAVSSIILDNKPLTMNEWIHNNMWLEIPLKKIQLPFRLEIMYE